MPRKTLLFDVLLALLCMVAVGCKNQNDLLSSLKPDKPRIVIPPYVRGTIAEYAVLAGGGSVPVQAHGVVVGLGNNGSAEVPASIYRAMVTYLAKQHFGSYTMGTSALTPERILSDKDTSVVLVGGAIRRGSPIGSRFDVFVTALPSTQTRSLAGGVLMPVDLALAYGGVSNPNVHTKIWARGGGAVFVNPFVDPTDPKQSAQLLSGRIIGGGVVTLRQPIRIQLHRPDYQLAEMIQRRIHTRFDPAERLLLSDVVKGRSRSMIELTVPPAYKDDYDHFLELVMHLPIKYGRGGWDAYAHRIVGRMAKPTANQAELGLVIEAMGRQVLPLVQGLYTSDNTAASFYAALAGLRLGDNLAVNVVLKYADSAKSPYQAAAIEELGRHPEIIKAGPLLRRLLNDADRRVRLLAYNALRRLGDRAAITTVTLPEQFKLDIVKTSRDYTIYATQTGEPRIVLFGDNMIVNRPVYFEAPDDLVTINAFADSKKMTIFRKVSVSGQVSEPMEVGFTVRDLVEVLGRIPEPDDKGKVHSLGLTYSQVVSVLYRMCKSGDIPAKFVLQPSAGMQKIYQGGAELGRPDMPG